MAESMEILTDSQVEEKVLKAQGIVIVDCWAPWCGPCRALAPILEEVSQEMASKSKIFSLNIDENPETPGKYHVMSIPTLLLFKDGEHEDTKVGSQTKSALIEWIEKHA